MSELITNTLETDTWAKDFSLISGLRSFHDDPEVMNYFYDVKQANKVKYA